MQINLNETKANEKAIPMMNLPFDLNRVRSMIDETNLSSNARQLMNNLQYMQQQRRTEESVSKGLNITQLMCMIKGSDILSFFFFSIILLHDILF